MATGDGGPNARFFYTAASIMTAEFAAPSKTPNSCYCPDCRGSGFDKTSKAGKRHARRCQRCRGKGSTEVGSTKR